MTRILFFIFSFTYLYFIQGDYIRTIHALLSKGTTSFSALGTAVFVSLCLLFLQQVIKLIIRPSGKYNALTYFPSYLTLGVITCADVESTSLYSLGWKIALPLLLIVFVIIGFSQKGKNKRANGRKENISESLVSNIFYSLVFMIMTVSIANTDKLIHYRMSMETKMHDGDYEGALQVAKDSKITDNSLTMLRIQCLLRTNQLDKLKDYCLEGTNDYALLPNSFRISDDYVENENNVVSLTFDEQYFTSALKTKRHITDLHPRKYLNQLLDNGYDSPQVKELLQIQQLCHAH